MAISGSQVIKIEGFELSCKLPSLAGNALRVFNQRGATLIKITTRSGAVGWGETWAFPAASSTFIRNTLVPIVMGADVTAPRAVQAKMLEQIIPDRRGQAHMAVSALDIALWDAFGQICKKPIYSLLGGQLRDRVRAYASGPLLQADANRYAGFEDELKRYVETGFNAVKIRIGTTMAQDVRAIAKAREILGEEALLMVDMNEGSTIRDAVRLAREAQDANLGWIEEPIPHDNLPGYKRLGALLPVPLAGGESFCGVQAFRDVLCEGALDVLQPDLAICGGITEGMKIAALADAFEVPVAPHVWGTGINFLASLQYTAVLSARRGEIAFPLFEYDMSFNPLREQIYDPRPDADGYLAIPNGPGLGIDIDFQRLEQFVTNHWSVEG